METPDFKLGKYKFTSGMPINVFEPKSQFLSSKTEINKAIKENLK